ncbi:MAG: hypothetical protein V4664_01270 [Patescibacteria group bacterium]
MKLPSFEFKTTPNGDVNNAEKAEQLRESLSKKTRNILNLRKGVDDHSVQNLSVDDFRQWCQKQKESLHNDFPGVNEQLAVVSENEKKITELRKLIAVINRQRQTWNDRAFDAYLKANPDAEESYTDEVDFTVLYDYYSEEDRAAFLNESEEDRIDREINSLEDENNKILRKSENSFVRIAEIFINKTAEKKDEVATLKDAYDKGIEFFIKEIIKQFLAKGMEVPLSLINYIKVAGEDLNIEFNAYDICVYMGKEEARAYFKQSSNGWHMRDTSFCFIVNRGDADAESYTKIHEQGHNRMECIKASGLHNVIYIEESMSSIKHQIETLRNLKSFRAPQLVIEGNEDMLRGKVRRQLNYLNGEISADAENIATGKLSAFYFHFLNTVGSLRNLIHTAPTRNDEVMDIVRREVGSLEVKVASHLKELLFLSFVARKYGKQDEFYSALIMDPEQTRLIKRILSEELGDNFRFEEQMFKIFPETILPENIHQRVYDISSRSEIGLMHAIFSVSSRLENNMIPPKTPLKKQKSIKYGGIQQRQYQNFEYVFAEEFATTNFLDPKEISNFTSVLSAEKLSQFDGRVTDKMCKLFEDAVGNNKFAQYLNLPTGLSVEEWQNTIQLSKKYQEDLSQICDYIGIPDIKKQISDSISEAVSYRALKLAVINDDLTPLKLLKENWEIRFGKEGLSVNELYDYYDIDYWFDTDNEREAAVLKEITENPERTIVFQYLSSILSK